MSDVVTLPISGSMYVGHSKKLEWALRNFITSMNGTYYDDELDKGFLTLYFRLKNGICIEQKIHIRKYNYICYTILSCYINPENKDAISKYVQIANSINLELDYGHFEVNFKTGDILFKSFYEPEDRIYTKSLEKLLYYPRSIINKFGHCFLLLDKK